MSIQTPLSKVRGTGSAKSGTSHFWHQRLTAIANFFLVIFLIFSIIYNLNSTHREVVEYIGCAPVVIAMALLILSTSYHMKLGMQVVIEDYIKKKCAKITLIILNIFFCSAFSIAGVFFLLKIALGAL